MFTCVSLNCAKWRYILDGDRYGGLWIGTDIDRYVVRYDMIYLSFAHYTKGKQSLTLNFNLIK